jgi:hypothetical protein
VCAEASAAQLETEAIPAYREACVSAQYALAPWTNTRGMIRRQKISAASSRRIGKTATLTDLGSIL